jgi:TPR repeat protein
MKRCRLIATLAVVIFGICTVCAEAQNESGPRAIGAGAFPVTFTHASAWFADRADTKQKVVTLLVYFAGRAGWENQSTDFKWEVNQNPAEIHMSVGEIKILVKYWSDTGDIEIQGAKYKLAESNVFLVDGIDSAKPVLRALGVQDLSFLPNEIPPIALLKRNSAVWAALSGRPASEHSRSPNSNTSAEVLAWNTGGLRLFSARNPEADQKACELFRQSALKGNADAQYYLGYCYETGRGVDQSFSTANDWYEKAANQGNVDAQYKLGHSYRTGRGVPIDLAVALGWYKKAANNGDRDALHNVAWMYATGQGTKASAEEAYRWILEAAGHGDISAQFDVARRLRDGDGVATDPISSYSWLLVLHAQEKNLPPDASAQLKETIKSVESQLDKEAIGKAESQAHDSLTTIAEHDMENFARP